MKIGFIGLGYMGSAIAKTLVNSGFEVVGYDIRKESVEELVKSGGKGASTPGEVASMTNCVITMVLNDAQTEEIILGKDGVLEGIKEGVVIIMSTASPSLVIKIADTLMKGKGIPVLDAPVSGVPGAAGGTMITMVGGDKEVLDKYRSVFDAMAKTVFYCGKSGSGAIAKITNALIWEVSWNAVVEALDLGAREGLDRDLLLSIYNQSTAGCWATRNWRWVEEMRNDPGPLQLEYKDMGMVVEFAKEKGAPAPLIDLCYARREK